MGFSLSRLEGVHDTSAHIKMARTSHIASPCVALGVPRMRRELDIGEHL